MQINFVNYLFNEASFHNYSGFKIFQVEKKCTGHQICFKMADKNVYRQTDKQTNKQTDRHLRIYIQVEINVYTVCINHITVHMGKNTQSYLLYLYYHHDTYMFKYMIIPTLLSLTLPLPTKPL